MTLLTGEPVEADEAFADIGIEEGGATYTHRSALEQTANTIP